MTYQSIVISSGHGLKVPGAAGIIDEVTEARCIVDRVAGELDKRGVAVRVFHDDTSTSQDQNLNTIVNFHNKQDRELDVSVHLNAYEQVDKPMGTEVLYVSQYELADQLSEAMAKAGGFIDRGAKKNTNLFFLNNTDMPSVLLEVCFVDSVADCELYYSNFGEICSALANVLGGPLDDADIDVPAIPNVPAAPRSGRVDLQVSGNIILTINGNVINLDG